MDFVRTVSESLIKPVCVKDEDGGTVLVVEAFEQELALNRASPTLWPGVVGVSGFKKTESVPYLIRTRSRHVTATGGYLVHLSKTRCWQLLQAIKFGSACWLAHFLLWAARARFHNRSSETRRSVLVFFP